MNAVTTVIRLLVAVAFINSVSCQDGFSEQDLLRLQQLTNPNDGQVETITSYSTNVIQRDSIRNEQSISPVSVQYHLTDDADKNNDYYRAGRSDRRKVIRIKNPFQRQLEPNESNHEDNTALQDNNPGSSNQYAAMQYSLPPEEFLQKMRAENQYVQQVSTPNPLLSYTATPQSQYQYPTNPSNSYENSHQSNQVSQVEPKSLQSQSYQSNPNAYQYGGGGGSYSYDSVSSTPSPASPYLSTANNQFSEAPANSYVSSASPVFLSSQPSFQQYASSPLSVIQTGSPDYSSSISTASSNTGGYDPNYQNKRIQIDHYDNSGNGMRYPINVQQYSQEYPSSTPSPASTPYPDPIHDSWQNAINAGVHSLSKSLQELSLSQYQNSQYQNQHDTRLEQNQENSNSETHRIGNMPAANNLYLDYVQPDYQTYNNIRARTRDLEHESGQPGPYSNGDYGWKVNEKKSLAQNDNYQGGNSAARYQTFGLHPDGNAVSQMNFYLDSSKSQSYDQISKSSPETRDESQEFAKAAAKAHEQMKQQQLAKLTESYFGHNNYASSFNNNNPVRSPQSPSTQISSSYFTNNDGQRNKLFADSSNNNPVIYGNSHQQDLITASPYLFTNSKESSFDGKTKLPFDHAKALKNIVPIDVSNVLSNEGQQKAPVGLDNNGNRYTVPNFNRDQLEQNMKQFYKPQSVTESYYKDKNSGYGYNIKSKPDDLTGPENLKAPEQSISYYTKQPQESSSYNQVFQPENKRYGENTGQQINYSTQASTNNYPNNIQIAPSTHLPLQEQSQRPQNQMPTDITSILKLNDIPYRLTQNFNSDSLRFNNNNFDQNGIPTPIPSRINQNVGVHQIDVANNLLKLMQGKQTGLNLNSNRPDIDLQSSGLLSTINGFRVANPFNVDLKLVAEMLKGKPAIDDSQMLSLRDQFSKPAPLKLDMSSLQQLLMKNDNYGSLESLNGGITALGNPYLDIYNSGRYPYQGVKYSRSQEEEENIPIADASNTHPIGAVIEQDDSVDAREVSEGTELTASDGSASGYEENRPKNIYSRENKPNDRHRHPNSLMSTRHSYQRRYPKSDVAEPYPLLKPPPPNHSRGRISKVEKRGPRRRRVNRPKYGRILKTEPLFESESNSIRSESEEIESKVPTLLRPPPSVPEARSDLEEVEEYRS